MLTQLVYDVAFGKHADHGVAFDNREGADAALSQQRNRLCHCAMSLARQDFGVPGHR